MNSKSLLILLACIALQVSVGSSAVLEPRGGARLLRRSKRTVFQMCDLIQRHTNRVCLDYYNYGCFCGLGNAGQSTKHLDDTDGCCRLHDECFGNVACFMPYTITYPQLVGYDVTCEEDGCQCNDSEVWSPCARSVCECDLRFAECLGQAAYNEDYRAYDWHLCNRT